MAKKTKPIDRRMTFEELRSLAELTKGEDGVALLLLVGGSEDAVSTPLSFGAAFKNDGVLKIYLEADSDQEIVD